MAAEIKTPKSNLTLPPIESLSDENSLRQSLSIAEIGMSELTPQAASLREEEKSLEDETKAFEKKQKEERAIVEKLTARFVEARTQYDERRRAYDERRRAHYADVLKQNEAVRASDSLAPERRNPATVSQLTDWARRINERRALLEKEHELRNQEFELLESKRQTALKYEQGATERLKRMHASLEAKIKAHNFKKELAYRQLKQCIDYAVQIRKTLATKFNRPEVFSPALDSAIEQLKAESNAGFDTR
jgi:hypothetical protein